MDFSIPAIDFNRFGRYFSGPENPTIRNNIDTQNHHPLTERFRRRGTEIIRVH